MQPAIEKIRTPHDSSLRTFVRRASHYPFEWHQHPEYELTLIVRGRGRRFVGDSVEEYREGDLVLLGSHLPHTWRSVPASRGERHEAVVVQFRREAMQEALLGLPELAHVRSMLDGAQRGAQFVGRARADVARSLPKLVKRRPLQRLTEFLQVLDLLGRSPGVRPLASGSYAIPRASETSERLTSVLAIIHRDFASPLRQHDVAQVAGLSPAAFSRFFRHATGKTYVGYLSDVRVGHACRQLVESTLPITQICFDSGFTNVSNFNRAFLDRHGMSPSKFRREFSG